MDSSSKSKGDAPVSGGILNSVFNIFASARRFVGDFLELVTLEMRRAGLTLMWLVALGVVAALLIVTAWFGLMAALVLWIVSMGVALAAAIAAAALLNLLVAGAVILFGIVLSRNLLFPATRHRLAGESSTESTEAKR